MSLQPNDNSDEDFFSLSGSVGRFGDNDRADVIKAQTLLANAGYYDLPEPGVPTGWPGGELNRSLIRFQKDHGLEPDGTLLPLGDSGVSQTGVGETMQALQSQLSDRLARYSPLTPEESDQFYADWMQAEREPGRRQSSIVLRSGGEDGAAPVGVKPAGPVMSDVDPAAPPEPKPGQQEAYLRSVVYGTARVLPQIPNLLRGLGLLAPGIALPLSGDTPAPADHDAGRTADPAQPEEDRQQADFARPQRGRIVIAEDGRSLHVPPLGAWADRLSEKDRHLAESFNEVFAAERYGLHSGGSRGSEQTQKDINTVIQACVEAAKTIFQDAGVTHKYGGNQDGKAKLKANPEEHLWNYDESKKAVRAGSNRADFSILIARNVAAMMRGNTYDSDGAGNPTDREARAADRIRQKTPGDVFAMFEKRPVGMTDDEFRRKARDICRDAMEKVRDNLKELGEFRKPPPKVPGEYSGPWTPNRPLQPRKR
jgi:hypothetical protein